MTIEVTEQLDALAARYGNRFLLEPAPDDQLPDHGMSATDAMRLLEEDLALDGLPVRNLATFVTTWMEPEARQVITDNLHRNFIDHAESAPELSRSAHVPVSPHVGDVAGRRPALRCSRPARASAR